jgi:hypothetical protein
VAYGTASLLALLTITENHLPELLQNCYVHQTAHPLLYVAVTRRMHSQAKLQ